MDIIRQLLGSLSARDFIATYYSQWPYSCPDRARPFCSFLSWEVVKAVIEAKRSVLRIVKKGEMVWDEADLSFAEARKWHARGHTLLLRYAERSHPHLLQLSEEFSRLFGGPVDIQAYCSPEDQQAFGWHYDVEDVFILQTQGSKEYTLHPNTLNPLPLLENMPSDLGYEREKSKWQFRCLLEEGDWLYIPSGWWHVAQTKRESMHLSIGILPFSRIQILQFLTQHLAHSRQWCERLPVLGELGAGRFASREEMKKAFGEIFNRIFHELWQEMQNNQFREDLVEIFLKRHSPLWTKWGEQGAQKGTQL